MRDEYQEHLEERLAAARAVVAECETSLKNYLAFRQSKQTSVRIASRSPISAPSRSRHTDDGEKPDRKGLRADGQTRDLLEYINNPTAGSRRGEIALAVGMTVSRAGQLCDRYAKSGHLSESGGRFTLTAAGLQLLRRSQPYKGSLASAPYELQQAQNETPPEGGESSEGVGLPSHDPSEH